MDRALPDGGLATGAVHEVLPASFGDFPAALGFSLGLVTRLMSARPGLLLWALPAHESFRQGALYPLGLSAFGFDPARIIQVRVPKAQNVLWALEEGLGQRAIAAVLGFVPGDTRAYDFAASRRLALRAAERGVTGFVLQDRLGGELATAADTRWRIASEPSAPAYRPGQTKPGLGAPRWHAELVKSKRGPTGAWQVEWDHETLSFHMATPLADRTPLYAQGSANGNIARALAG